jgi:hypothetical protein
MRDLRERAAGMVRPGRRFGQDVEPVTELPDLVT